LWEISKKHADLIGLLMGFNMGFNGDRMGKIWAKIQYALWYLSCLQESSWPYR
jgi:hypothetical protein